MPTMIADPDAYFAKGCGRCDRFATPDCATALWAGGLARLRAICLSSGAEETAKWGHPCYMHAGRNIALIGAFRGEFRLSFIEAGLLADPEGVLERQGPNTRYPDMIRFTTHDGPDAMADVIRAYLAEAMGHAETGRRVPRDESEPDLPEDLTEALDADPEMAEAFAALTRGRRKSYAIALSSAKKAETRARRIAAFRDRILAGKGAAER